MIANNAFVLGRPDAQETSDLKTVRLVQDDEPVDWTWEGNVTDGDLGMPARDGIKTGKVDVDYLPNGVVAPAESSGLIGNAEGNYPDITTDALGHSRGEWKTIGCVEFPTEMEDGGPLTAADVGPEW